MTLPDAGITSNLSTDDIEESLIGIFGAISYVASPCHIID
jgi:hypothetical protein